MRIRVQVLIESDQEAASLHVEEVACFERQQLTPETLGLRLDEAKQVLAGAQQVMTESQVEGYVEQQRQCSHCQQPLAHKGHHQISMRTLFGKLTFSSPRLYTCSCQPHQKHSWSPIAALFPERSTPELLCQEVRWASLLSYGVTVKLLSDLLPMEHQLSTSTVSRHAHQVAERLESELGNEQPSFIEGCPAEWYELPKPAAPLVVSLVVNWVRLQQILRDHVRIRQRGEQEFETVGGRGRCALQGWPEILIGTVIKKTAKKRVVEVIRRMAQGSLERAKEVLSHTMGGKELNTAFIERFNGTMRERLASLTRRCRHAARRVAALEAGMWLVGCTYNWCWPHHELSRRLAQARECQGEVLITPAMASGLTDHIWSVREVLTYRIAPPPWVAPKRRGRPKGAGPLASSSSPARPRPLLRLRKGVLCSSTI